MTKKSLAVIGIIALFLLSMIIVFKPKLTGFVVEGDNSKIEISTTKESFSPGESIQVKVSLYDSSNNLIDDTLEITIEDAKKLNQFKKIITSNKFEELDVGENPSAGFWTIKAEYRGRVDTKIISIETNEEVKFSIEGDILTISNTGNAKYSKTIQIIIGQTIGTKDVELNSGQTTEFRLIAPDGVYNIRITDGTTTFTKGNVQLTGNVIGVLDEKLTEERNPVTGTLRPREEAGEESYTQKNNTFVYLFILVVIGAAILLAVERRFKGKY